MLLHTLFFQFLTTAVSSTTTTTLFGSPWNASDWVSSDDTVRGGSSTSHLLILSPSVASFTGKLDYTTLGGAGFASQRTSNSWPFVDLSSYDALVLDVEKSDGKVYTVNVFDSVPTPPSNESSVTWSYDFQLHPSQAGNVTILFEDLEATFRGRPVNDTAPLDLASIKRISIMIRSFFAEQAGDFELQLRSISASKSAAVD